MDLRPILDGLAEKAKAQMVVEEGDYLQDGLLYCGKCHTPKQMRIKVGDYSSEPFCLCECQKAVREAEEKARRIRKRREWCFEHEKMRDWTFDKDDGGTPKMTAIAKGYVERFPEMLEKNRGLLFFGRTGVGKTFIACCIANALIDRGYVCQFAEIPTEYDEVETFLSHVSYPDLLILDDFASERNTEWMQETVKRVIDERYTARKPLIVTTNLTAEELKNTTDKQKARIYSRLFEMCFPVEFVGEERRRKSLNRDYAEYEAWLNGL